MAMVKRDIDDNSTVDQGFCWARGDRSRVYIKVGDRILPDLFPFLSRRNSFLRFIFSQTSFPSPFLSNSKKTQKSINMPFSLPLFQLKTPFLFTLITSIFTPLTLGTAIPQLVNPSPFTYNARGYNFTFSNYAGSLGAPSALGESILECQYAIFQAKQQAPNLDLSSPIAGGSYACPSTDIVINATNYRTLFQGQPSAIGRTLGRRALTLNSMGASLSPAQGIEFNFTYVEIVNLMDGLYLGALSYGDQGLPSFSWQAFGLVQGSGSTPNQAIEVARGTWA